MSHPHALAGFILKFKRKTELDLVAHSPRSWLPPRESFSSAPSFPSSGGMGPASRREIRFSRGDRIFYVRFLEHTYSPTPCVSTKFQYSRDVFCSTLLNYPALTRSFAGNIPLRLGQLDALKLLDLANNKLYGDMNG